MNMKFNSQKDNGSGNVIKYVFNNRMGLSNRLQGIICDELTSTSTSMVSHWLADKNAYRKIIFGFDTTYGRTKLCLFLQELLPNFAKKVIRESEGGDYSAGVIKRPSHLILDIRGYNVVRLNRNTYGIINVISDRNRRNTDYTGSDFSADRASGENRNICNHAAEFKLVFHIIGLDAMRIHKHIIKRCRQFFQKDEKNDQLSINIMEIPSGFMDITVHADEMSQLVFDAKDKLLSLLSRFTIASQYIESMGIRSVRGILLYGGTGTGKTSFIYAYARMMNYPVTSIRASRLINHRSKCKETDDIDSRGNSSIGVLAELASHLNSFLSDGQFKMVIVMIDEIDRFVNSVGVADTLSIIDSLPNRCILMATTNHLDQLDSAILRSGRFDYKFELANFNSPADAESLCREFNITDVEKIQSIIVESTLEDGKINPATLKTNIVDTIMDDFIGKGDQ